MAYKTESYTENGKQQIKAAIIYGSSIQLCLYYTHERLSCKYNGGVGAKERVPFIWRKKKNG